jgi:glycosyltransferase involved in cell wall biosynthesis
VESALRESADGDEVIVVNDGSTDETESVLRSYGTRIRYIYQKNSGAGSARNHGVREARNRLIAFLDSDDEWMPGKMALQRAVFQAHPEVAFCFTDFATKDAQGEVTRRYLQYWTDDCRSWEEILGPAVKLSTGVEAPTSIADTDLHVGDLYLCELTANYVSTFTLMVNRETAANALIFAEDIPTFEDWECYGRLAKTGPGAYLDCETAWNYGHSGSRLTDANALERSTARIKILQRVWGQDASFLRHHSELYMRTIALQRIVRIKELLTLGRASEARAELNEIQRPPFRYRVLTAIPTNVVRKAIQLYRKCRNNL